MAVRLSQTIPVLQSEPYPNPVISQRPSSCNVSTDTKFLWVSRGENYVYFKENQVLYMYGQKSAENCLSCNAIYSHLEIWSFSSY